MSLLSSIASLLGQTSVQAVGAGLLSGVVAGGALVATGALPLGGQSAAVSISLTACPGGGPVLTQAGEGQSLLVTGRSADGAWFEVFLGMPGLDRAWAAADSLRFDSPADALPVVDCSGPTPAPLPSPAPTTIEPPPTPSPAPTTIEPPPTPSAAPTATAKPTPKPTPKPTRKPPKPTAAPTAAPTPDTTPPSITNFGVAGAPFDGVNNRYYIMAPGNSCGVPTSATISVSISDPSGLAGGTVKLFFYEPGTSNLHQQPMALNLGDHLWRSTISAPGGWLLDNQIVYWIEARDKADNLASTYPDAGHTLFYSNCFV
jgi:hypothetical protein